ncbi:MAG: hypothetical protein J5758_07155, partial [Abditibacteriota bacterium]|nr:hypothetical protein [Abditibacteriota bacterium]
MIIKVFILFCVLLLSASVCRCQTVTAAAGKGFSITGDNYTARIASDTGYLVSLVIGGAEALENRAAGVLTSYFNAPGMYMVMADEVTQSGNSVTAKSVVGSVTYTFDRDSVTITASGDPKTGFDYYLSLNYGVVMGVRDGARKKIPFDGEPGAYRWISQSLAFEAEGDAVPTGASLSGQVYRFPCGDGSSKSLTFRAASLADGDSLACYKAFYDREDYEDSADIVMFSPRDWQVFQRQSKYEGGFFFSGKVNCEYDKVYYRIKGKGLNGRSYSGKWTSLKTDPRTGCFDQYVKGWAGGWYVIDIKAEKDKRQTALVTLEHVGIGEVFVGAGQSNSTNSSLDKIQTQTGMVSATDGFDWAKADDPMPGTHDRGTGGSYYPAFGDAVYEALKVPVGIASTGHGGSIVSQWYPGSEYYEHFMARVRQLGKGGFRAVLWHQGESDCNTEVESMFRGMKTLIRYSCLDAGWRFPWFVAKVSYHNPDHMSWENPRKVHQMVWDSGLALAGPDTDTLHREYRDLGGIAAHFNAAGLKKHGEMWAELL